MTEKHQVHILQTVVSLTEVLKLFISSNLLSNVMSTVSNNLVDHRRKILTPENT